MPPTPKKTLVVLGMMGRCPFGGQTWLYLNWLRSLAKLGHEVWYVEDDATWPYDPRADSISEDPAYAVEYLTYTVDETPRNYDAIQLTVGYRRTAAQVAGIVHITSTSALGDLLREAARNHAAELVVQVGYFDHQAEEVRTQVTQIQAEVEPESKEPWTVNFYPDSGNAGIIEVLLSGAGSAEGAEQNTKNTN